MEYCRTTSKNKVTRVCTLCNDRRTKIKLRIYRALRRMRYNFNEFSILTIKLLAIHRYLRSRLTIVRNNAQKSSIYDWLDLSAASLVRGQSVGIKLIATRLWSLYTYYFSPCMPAWICPPSYSLSFPLSVHSHRFPPSARSPLSDY